MLRRDDPAYTVATGLLFERPLDATALKKAIHAVVFKHAALRTSFGEKAGEPIAICAEATAARADVRSVAASDEDSLSDYTNVRCTRAAAHVFDLRSGRPPNFFEIVELNGRPRGLVICQHHIVTDGWSVAKLCEALAYEYDAQLGLRAALEQPGKSYADYACQASANDFGASLDYWRRKLTPLPTPLAIPFARTRPSEQRFSGRSAVHFLDAEALKGIALRAQQASATPFIVLLSLVSGFLARLSEQTDFVLGTPYANRSSDEFADVLGLFVNSVALRQTLGDDPSLVTLIARTRLETIEALDHGDTPIEEIVDALGLPRTISHNPLFQVLVTYQTMSIAPPAFGAARAIHVFAESHSTRFDLEWTFFPDAAARGFRLTWNTDIIEDADAGLLGRLFCRFAEQWLAAPSSGLSQISMLDPDAAIKLIRRNPGALPRSDLDVAEAFSKQAKRSLNDIAVSARRCRYTFEAIESAAERLAALLRRIAISRCVVATLIDREPELLPVILAIAKVGCVLLPLDPQQPAARFLRMTEDAGAAVVVTKDSALRPSDLFDKLSVLDVSALLAEGGEGIFHACDAASAETDLPEDAAYILFTSGTTGIPKGVVVQHKSLMNTLLATAEAFSFDRADVFPLLAPIGFDIFFFELFSAVLAGGEAMMVGPQDLLDEEFLRAALARATCLQAVPGLMNMLLAQMERVGPCLAMRQVTTGGDRVPPRLLSRMRRQFPNAEISVTYGPTETAILASRYVVTSDVEGHPIGRPLKNVALLVADEHGRVVPDGIEGELWIGGAGVAWGYHNRPSETASKFVSAFGDRFYRSGDRCRWRAGNILEFLGRKDNQVKVRGFRIELGEVEAKIADHFLVEAAVSTSAPDGRGDADLLAFYVRAETPSIAIEDDRSVEEWTDLFDFMHSGDAGMFTGWHSSYDGRPLPIAEMQEWKSTTLSQLQAILSRYSDTLQRPQILEIGCGVGMLLLNLAPLCARYDATDLSSVLTERLLGECRRVGIENADIVRAQATDPVFMSRTYDLVIMNSVAQYFPSYDYLSRALQRAWERLRDGGTLFLGDVRAYHLHNLFLGEIAAFKNPANDARMAGDVLRLKARENELLLHPAAFEDIAQRLGDVASLHTSPKMGGAPNEVTRYRFDVLLTKGKVPVERVAQQWVSASADQPINFGQIAQLLAEGADLVGLNGISNPWTNGRSKEPGAYTPADFVDRCRAHGLNCRLSWRAAHPDGAFDAAIYLEHRALRMIDFPSIARIPPRAQLSNQPISRKALASERLAIRNHVKATLPSYMTPSFIEPISEIPLTKHGKVDRNSLPTLAHLLEGRFHEPPKTPHETLIGDIWRSVLDLSEMPGRADNFFQVGGTSLSAIRVATKLRAAGFPLRPQLIFTHQTLAELAGVLGDLQVHGQHVGSDDMPSGRVALADPAKNIARDDSWHLLSRGSTVMLTGATGFLGIHLLRDLLRRKDIRIICPIRTIGGVSARDRLNSLFHWYFHERLENPATALDIFPADLANGPLTWAASPPPWVPDTIIHAAADVRHIGPSLQISRTNINSTAAVIALAAENGAVLHHLSSVGVAGIWQRPGPPPLFQEDDLDVGQKLTEAYSESKLAAERLVRQFQASGGKAIIYRASTVGPHSQTARFQKNISAHFLSRHIKACIELSAAPKHDGNALSLVPVDIMAAWITRIACNIRESTAYHLVSEHTLPYRELYQMLNVAGYHLDLLDEIAFKDVLFRNMNFPAKQDAVGVFLKTVNEGRVVSVPLLAERSSLTLKALGAPTFKADQSWIARFLAHAVEVGYLPPP